MYLEIEKVIGREILDSRGNPTVEAEVYLMDGTVARGTAPSGASTGEFEALELRDGDKARYLGKGVQKAVENINTTINEAIEGLDASDIYAVDAAMIAADGTKDKSRLGANAILAVSIACARAAANALEIPLYRFFGGVSGNRLPVPMMNIMNGGKHADNTIDIQEFMVIPLGCPTFADGLERCVRVTHRLGALLEEAGLACGVVFVASVHCDTLEALNRKPPTTRLLAMGAFETLVLLDGRVNPGHAVKVRTLA